MALPHHKPDDGSVVVEQAADLARAVRRVRRGERVAIVDDNAQPVAAIVSLADVERLRLDDLRRERAAAVASLYEVADRFRDLDAEETDRQAQEAVDAIRAVWRNDAAARP